MPRGQFPVSDNNFHITGLLRIESNLLRINTIGILLLERWNRLRSYFAEGLSIIRHLNGDTRNAHNPIALHNIRIERNLAELRWLFQVDNRIDIFPLEPQPTSGFIIRISLQAIGQQYTPPSQTSLILSLETVFTLFAGMLFLHEVLTVCEYIGCAVMFAAIIISQKQPKSSRL